MSKLLNIIPTPRHCEYTDGGVLTVSRVYCESCFGKRIEAAQSLLAKNTEFTMSELCDADLIITNDIFSYFSASELEFFKEKYADKQGYILKKASSNSPTIIAAPSENGCAYGVMTLIQLLGKKIGSITIRDWPDFKIRGNKWQIWAESGIWSYDYGDGPEAIKERFVRKVEMNALYKINAIYADSFGLDADRFHEYSDIMRTANDRARELGISLYTGCYGMSYGQSAFGNTFYGNAYLNRKSYPDGEAYECMGTYDAWDVDFDNEITDYSHRLTNVYAREYGTCFSNEALFSMKVDEMKEYITKTHCGGLYIHNMDAHEMHLELWLARCEECRKKWPNDDIFARDGAAGAFAEYFSNMANELSKVRDGDYDASKHFKIMLVSPGYLYPVVTNDDDFDTGVRFWKAVSECLTTDIIAVGFREQFFYHEKPVRRAEKIIESNFKCDTMIINFSGGDGYYDDKIFTPTSSLNYIMKGFDGMLCANGNGFQEPIQLFNAEYMWNSEHSAFFNVEDKPQNQTEFLKLYRSAIGSRFRPDAIYGEGGFLDVICRKIYGENTGNDMAKLYKLAGKNGEPPILCASSVDIYTNFSKIVFPMRWDNADITAEKIAEMTERFKECSISSGSACALVSRVAQQYDGNPDTLTDLEWLAECADMGSRLTELLYEYMLIYSELDSCFAQGRPLKSSISDDINALRTKIASYNEWINSSHRKPIDKLGGGLVRRKNMGDMLDYWITLMLSSIKQGKRIPDDAKPLPTKRWW